MWRTYSRKNGFSFLELLVTMTIIGVLAVAGIVSYRMALSRSRDNKRRADLEQIRAALEMYRADEGEYPGSLSSGGSISGPAGTYMESVPFDPEGDSYSYTPDSPPTSYELCAEEMELGDACVTNP